METHIKEDEKMGGKKFSNSYNNTTEDITKALREPCVSCIHKEVCGLKRIMMAKLGEDRYDGAITFTGHCVHYIEVEKVPDTEEPSEELEGTETENVTDIEESEEVIEDLTEATIEVPSGEEEEVVSDI
jgi:hypothetical protein